MTKKTGFARMEFLFVLNDCREKVGIDMNATGYMRPKQGLVSPHLEVSELIVRSVPKYNYYPELDGIADSDVEQDAGEIEYEDRLQGFLLNTTKSKLNGVKYSLAYYDSTGLFLGLSKSRFLEEDELDVGDHLPIDFAVRIPDDAAECVFNARAKMPGRIGRMFWG